jgi:hypothetical protein
MKTYSEWAKDIVKMVGTKGAEKLIAELEKLIKGE